MESMERESWLKSLLVAGFLSLLSLGIGLFALRLAKPKDDDYNKLLVLAKSLGKDLSGELLAGLAVIAAIQAAVLIVVMGGNAFAKSAIDEVNRRDALRIFGTFPVWFMTPAVALAILGGMKGGDAAGSLFIVVPLYLIQFAIAVFLGTFKPGSRNSLRVVARENAKKANIAVAFLRELSQTERLVSLDTKNRKWRTVAKSVLAVSALAAIISVAEIAHFRGQRYLWWSKIYVAMLAASLLYVAAALFMNKYIKPLTSHFEAICLGVVIFLWTLFLVGLGVIAWLSEPSIGFVVIGTSISGATLVFLSIRDGLIRRQMAAGRNLSTMKYESLRIFRVGTLLALGDAEKMKVSLDAIVCAKKDLDEGRRRSPLRARRATFSLGPKIRHRKVRQLPPGKTRHPC